jgi:hypothetical protein
VISAKPDAEGTEFAAEAVVVPEDSYLDEGEPPPVAPTPITNEPPALFAVDELEPATLAEVVIPAKPAVEGREFAAGAGVEPEESYVSEGEPPPVSPPPITNEPRALFATNELKAATLTEVVTPAKPEVEDAEFAAEAGLMLEESHTLESGPAPVLSQPIMVEQPAMVAENQLRPASPNEIVISANPKLQTFTTKVGAVRPAAQIVEVVLAPISSTLSEKVHYGLLHGIDEVFAEEPPFCLEELQAFSALCNEILRPNASNTGGSQQ